MKQLTDIRLKERDANAIRKACRLLKQRFPVTAVTLFGSKARGDDDAESDIDLLVLTSRPIGWRTRDQMTDAVFDIQLKHDVVINLLVIPQEKWEKGILLAHPIHDEIEAQGVAA